MTDNIKCPHCEHEHADWHEYIDFERDEHVFYMECEDCGEAFEVGVEVTRTFTTSKDW